ncbi:hypothetical protein [Cytobacillus gottheilii]|uniref:hypothetical protein n=1 Tax=Cytobacillus gottheilii TaxID=859144 RepID=UPI002493F6FF|nr:hypothetical protein [Cytobacillus gottheilii]
MKLDHYTSDLRAAKSIITTQELWMGNTGKAPKDANEILHYFNIFNDYHNITDLSTLINNPDRNNNQNTHDPLLIRYIMGTAHSYFMRENKLRIGDIFASVIREESYIVCFTAGTDDNNDFHTDTYGPISFHFKENPLIEDKDEFVYIEAPVHYLDTNKLSNINSVLNEMYDVLLLPYHEFFNRYAMLDTLQFALRKSLKANYNSNGKKKERNNVLKELKTRLEQISTTTEDFSSQVRYYNLFMESNMDANVLNYLRTRVARIREQQSMKKISLASREIFRKNGTFRYSDPDGHTRNIISCFIKDKKFENDNEIRVIALPKKEFINPENKLRSSYDIKKLEYISVSKNYPNREIAINELQELLITLGHTHVKVR